jgi:hypothetical protein
MTARDQNRTGPDGPGGDTSPWDDANPVNPAGAAPDGSALSNDTSDDRVLTPGENAHQPVEDRRPDGAERQYERSESGVGGTSRGEDATTPDARRQEFAPARELPIRGYENLTIPEIVRRIPTLSNDQLREIQDYERSHRRRKTLLVRLERQLRNA